MGSILYECRVFLPLKRKWTCLSFIVLFLPNSDSNSYSCSSFCVKSMVLWNSFPRFSCVLIGHRKHRQQITWTGSWGSCFSCCFGRNSNDCRPKDPYKMMWYMRSIFKRFWKSDAIDTSNHILLVKNLSCRSFDMNRPFFIFFFWLGWNIYWFSALRL